MQEYLLIEKEKKANLVLALRLAESSKIRFGGDAALEFLSEKIVNLIPGQDVFALICEIENNQPSSATQGS